MLKDLIQAAIEAIFAVIFGRVDKAAGDKARTDAAVTTAENQTLKDVAETADAQASNNAADRGSARDVARRMRERLAADSARDQGKP